MVTIKEAYQQKYPDKAVFTKAIIQFVNDPKKENVLLKTHAKELGVMQKLPIGDKKFKQIAEYVYNNVSVKK